MTAISKPFTAITDSQIDVDSPIDTVLMTSLRDSLINLREWLGANYVAGAVQNHNHDGVNSAEIPVGANFLRNGSFESGTEAWVTTQYTGGTVAVNTAQHMDGASALAITSTILANGGGDAVSTAFIAVTGGNQMTIKASVKASVANVSSKIEAIWYDSTQAQISVSTIYSSVNTPITPWIAGLAVAAPTTARFLKIKIIGGVPATGTATGTVYFDGITVRYGGLRLAKYSTITATNATWAKQPETLLMTVTCLGGGGGGGSGNGDRPGTGGSGGQLVTGEIVATTATYNAVVGGGGGASGTGGTTSFGGVVSAPGGAGGITNAWQAVSSGTSGTNGGGNGGGRGDPANPPAVAANSGAGGGGAGSTTGASGGSGVIWVWEFA